MAKLDLTNSILGNLRVVELLEQGGMGTVYSAYDETLQRRVAIKALQYQNRLDTEARARFLREARILSRLQHPNICQIHDYLSHEGSSYLVLELIEGETLGTVDKNTLSAHERMRIAQQLVSALIAAHEKGIIHRDLKPANVMLTTDRDVKVLDFGLARTGDEDAAVDDYGTEEVVPGAVVPGAVAVGAASDEGEAGGDSDREEESSVEHDVFTTQIGSVIGTVAFMSPEQACGESATAASDMYSCGLLLQELFTGEQPYELELPPAVQLLRASQAQTRPIEGLDADLTALIQRLLSLAPGARPSAADTAERLRWIEEKPRRRWRRMATVTAVGLLVLLAAVMTFQSFRVAQEADRANREAAVAKEVSDFLVDLFEVSDPSEARGATVTAQEILDAGAQRVRTELLDQPLTQSRLMDTIGMVYRELGLYARSEALLRDGLDVRLKQYGDNHLDVADSQQQLGYLYSTTGKYDQAVELFQAALATRERQLGTDHPLVATSLGDLALAYRDRGQNDLAEPLLRRSLQINEAHLGPFHPDLATSLNNLAVLYYDQGNYQQANPLFVRDLEISQLSLGEDHPDVAITLNNMGTLYRRQGDLDQSEKLYLQSLDLRRTLFGSNHPKVATTLHNLAELYRMRGEFEKAVESSKEAAQIWRKAFGELHPNLAAALFRQGVVLTQQGEVEAASLAFQQALAIQEQAHGEDHLLVARSISSLAELYSETGSSDLASPLFQRVMAIVTASEEDDSIRIDSMVRCGRHFLSLGRLEEAEQSLQRALESVVVNLARKPRNRDANTRLATLHLSFGELAAARSQDSLRQEHGRKALDILASLTSEPTVEELDLKVRSLLLLGELNQARPLAEDLDSRGWKAPAFRRVCRLHRILS